MGEASTSRLTLNADKAGEALDIADKEGEALGTADKEGEALGTADKADEALGTEAFDTADMPGLQKQDCKPHDLHAIGTAPSSPNVMREKPFMGRCGRFLLGMAK